MEWISVKDKLPERDTWIATYGFMQVPTMICQKYGKHGFQYNPTHWMPLPEPPK